MVTGVCRVGRRMWCAGLQERALMRFDLPGWEGASEGPRNDLALACRAPLISDLPETFVNPEIAAGKLREMVASRSPNSLPCI